MKEEFSVVIFRKIDIIVHETSIVRIYLLLNSVLFPKQKYLAVLTSCNPSVIFTSVLQDTMSFSPGRVKERGL